MYVLNNLYSVGLAEGKDVDSLDTPTSVGDVWKKEDGGGQALEKKGGL